MNEVHANIERLEEKAINLKNAKKYLDALKKYEEVIQLKKENFGDRDEGTLRTSGEAAIVCNILSMSFLQKGTSLTPKRYACRKLLCGSRAPQES